VDALMVSAGVGWQAEPGERPFLHPGRAARILAGDGRELGWLGELHPLVLRDWELNGPVAAFELDMDLLAELAGEHAEVYRDVTSFPSVRLDIAVVVPETVPAADVERAVRAGAGDLLAGLSVFDLYRGEQVGEGRKSLALRLEFRAQDRTLTDEDVAEPRARIEQELAALGGALRA
jgi:phenylalanyl-tRNA synthetase beta chain